MPLLHIGMHVRYTHFCHDNKPGVKKANTVDAWKDARFIRVERWLYGTKGYGKPLLAALTCYLLSLKRRVIFIPDASETVRNWVSTVRKALLFAQANSRKVVHQVMMLENPQAIIDFLEA